MASTADAGSRYLATRGLLLVVQSVGVFGIAVIVLQSVFHLSARLIPALAPLWSFVYMGGGIKLGGIELVILYNIVPWIGVMAAGYGFGLLLLRDPVERRRICLRIGLGATAAFLLIALSRLRDHDRVAVSGLSLVRRAESAQAGRVASLHLT